MTTRLKIDLLEGILEVEGSEAFVKAIYADFKAYFIGDEAAEELFKPKRGRRTGTASRAAKTSKATVKPQLTLAGPPPETKETASMPAAESPTPVPAKPARKPKTSPPKPSYTFLKDLDLSAADGRPSLVEFMDAKFPITNVERNLVFLHYLQYTLKIKRITVDHVYTCYRAAKIRAPLDLESSLQATVEQRRWIKITKTGKLSVTPAGKLYVEKHLPKKVKS